MAIRLKPLDQQTMVTTRASEAASEGGRDVTAGAMAKLDTAVSRLLPSPDGKMTAMQAHRQ